MASIMRASSEYSMDSPQQTNHDPRKRKGGRKAMYTEEARKQRNRDAQAAFRERRIEYIKELEERVKSYSTRIRCMEAARSNSMDECLMLRYKNSLLERILLHKGIDVNAELNTKLWRPVEAPNPQHLNPSFDSTLRPSKQKAKDYHPSTALEMTSPVSTASDSTIPTPPAPASTATAPPHKQAKTHSVKATHILSPPDGSKDPDTARAHAHAHSRATQNEPTCNDVDVDFLSMADDDALGMMGFEDFDFSMEFTPMQPLSALSF